MNEIVDLVWCYSCHIRGELELVSRLKKLDQAGTIGSFARENIWLTSEEAVRTLMPAPN